MRLFITLFIAMTPLFFYAQSNDALSAELRKAIKGKKAEVGIAVIIDGKDTITLNNDIRYPLMSVFKFHQAMALMEYMSQKNIPLDTQLPITPSDLKPDTYSPLRVKHPAGGINISIAELLKYTLQLSDNNACDILFRYQGGTEPTNKFIHSLGIGDCEIKYNEDEMHQDINRSYQNWSSPLAAAKLMELFLNKPLFAKPYKDFIYQTIVECKTGTDRLSAPLLDKGVMIGHKTGTGDLNSKGQQIAVNDIGFVLLPNGRSYSIAVFVKDSEEANADNSKIIAEVSRIVYEYVSNQQVYSSKRTK